MKQRNGSNIYIKAESITYHIKDKIVLNDFSFCFKPGKLFILKGESGCGKSTLLSILAKFNKPSSGKVSWSSSLKASEISFFSEASLCFFDLTLYENLSCFHKQNKDIDEVLSLVGLSGRQNQLTNTLSKGEIARLCIAQMILLDLPVLFFDEPTANLDEDNRNQIFDLIRCLARNKIVIVSSHDITSFCENDVLLTYDGNHSFQKQIPETEKHNPVDENLFHQINRRSHRKKHPPLKIKFHFEINVLKRCVKPLFILFPVFCFLLYCFLCITSFVGKSGNQILYEDMKSSQIIGSVIEKNEAPNDFVLQCISGSMEDNQDCLLLYVKDSSFPVIGKNISFQTKNGAFISSSFATKYGLKIGDRLPVQFISMDMEYNVEGIYEEETINPNGVFANINDDVKQMFTVWNNPVLVSSMKDSSSSSDGFFYFALRDYFKTENSMMSNPFILQTINSGYFLANKKSYDIIYYYFLLADSLLILIVLYFIASCLTKAFQGELLLFDFLGKDRLDSIRILLGSGIHYISILSLFSFLVYWITLPYLNPFLSDFYMLKEILNLFTLSRKNIYVFLVIFGACILFILLLLLLTTSSFLRKKHRKREE